MKGEHLSAMALYPASRGYGFVMFARAGKMVDWGMREIRGSRRNRNAASLADIELVLDKYQPDTVLLEDHTAQGSRRSVRIRRLQRLIAHSAQTRNMEVEWLSRQEIRAVFASVGAVTRYEIAQAVGIEFPELGYRLPKRRRAWQGEPAIMALFAAAALAVTYYRATPRVA